MRIAIQVDPLERLAIPGDSSIAMARAALARGHEVAFFYPDSLSRKNGNLFADLSAVQSVDQPASKVALAPAKSAQLKEYDCLAIRQDPPIDMAYLTNAYLFHELEQQVFCINRPSAILLNPEKLSVRNFPQFTPPTLITRAYSEAIAFFETHGDIIMKPLFGNGGAAVFRVKAGDSNFNGLFEAFTQQSKEPFILQAFLPAVTKGDIRVLFTAGEKLGQINRVPLEGEHRANMHVGAAAQKVQLTERQETIVTAVGVWLKNNRITFAGIDLIGDYLTEINITSPTGLIELSKLEGFDAADRFWESVEQEIASSRP